MEDTRKETGWIDQSLPVDWSKVKEEAIGEILPHHMKLWWYCLGGIPALMFLLLIVSGFMLAFHYVPHPDQAYESVAHITHDLPYGWWVRSLHRWAAELMVVTVSLHTVRVFVTQAYRHPREVCWITGALLLLLTMATAFTGYSLVYSQMSYWAMTIGTQIAAKTPIIGGVISRFMLGGEAIGPHTLNRFFILHAAVLPALLMLLIIVHIIVIRLHGVAEHVAGMQREIVRGLSRGDE
jgi:quinol-cytochrome oxidoreductase complex cytochrome b subunit